MNFSPVTDLATVRFQASQLLCAHITKVPYVTSTMALDHSKARAHADHATREDAGEDLESGDGHGGWVA